MVLDSSDFDPISQIVPFCFPRGYSLLQEILVVIRVLSQAPLSLWVLRLQLQVSSVSASISVSMCPTHIFELHTWCPTSHTWLCHRLPMSVNAKQLICLCFKPNLPGLLFVLILKNQGSLLTNRLLSRWSPRGVGLQQNSMKAGYGPVLIAFGPGRVSKWQMGREAPGPLCYAVTAMWASLPAYFRRDPEDSQQNNWIKKNLV